MSVSVKPAAGALDLPGSSRRRLALRLALALAAVAAVALAAALLLWWLAPGAAPPARNPFGMGLREAAPTGGLGAYILDVQGRFYRGLQQAVAALKDDGAALRTLVAIGFAYGVFHAAGPGHGKGVIAAYLVADGRALAKGFALSLAAALVQALVAILIVSVFALLFRATAATMTRVATAVEWASFAAVALVGALLAWRKAGRVLDVLALARGPMTGPACGDCDHVHMPEPEELRRLTRWRDMAGVVLAAGMRPCTGALVVLVFALSQGLFAAGVAATLAMALGTALTTGAIAALAVFAKKAALALAGGRGARGEIAIALMELLAAAFVAVLGGSLLFGFWASGAAS
ncbi:nickel/cobalt transporter [Microvirga thermotolerans]|uniref:Nickel/cobalt efflux system n=1 Tax=Microvirga thermotolerans TaxID=2651334 RepID=A0A5P9JTE9_9HYPH|nr:nickel transporter [Microvirga thermotolerans]QFU15399.1 nickel transporter [Microvirga thermotolerans]